MSEWKYLVPFNKKVSWTYSWILGLGYLVAFASMTIFDFFSMGIGCVFGFFLTLCMIQAWRSNYFFNKWDFFAHGVVVLDVFLEAILIKSHDHWGFLFCWLAFGLVIVCYRSLMGSKHP